MQITKLDAALRQLNAAAKLFIDGDYVSSLTLAGAAEEIIGKMLKRHGESTALERIAAHHRGDTDPNLSDAEHMKLVTKLANQARNAAKHHDSQADDAFDNDRDHALMMLMRALPMVARLWEADPNSFDGLPPGSQKNIERLHRWIVEYLKTT